MKAQESETGLKRVHILGYTGEAVDLSDYGVDAPVVYITNGIKAKKAKIPYLFNHRSPVGHIEDLAINNNKVECVGVHSFPSQESSDIAGGIENGMPYEASMGVVIEPTSIIYHESGTVEANGRTFQAPVYTVGQSTIVEMSACLFGRDDNTSITKLSKETLMTIKNSKLTKPSPPEDSTVIPQGITSEAFNNAIDWLIDYPEHKTLVRNAIKNGWDKERLENEIKYATKIDNYKGVPSGFRVESKQSDIFTARMALSLGISPEFLETKFTKEAVGNAHQAGYLGLREALMQTANSNGGQFTGYSDVENMCKFHKRLHNSAAYSTIDFPNLMHRVAQWKLEESWKIDPIFAPSVCKQLSNKDFKATGHIRPEGGSMWNGLNREGKIDHGSFGEEQTYSTKLTTVAQMLTFKREDIVNDDIGLIQEMLDLMVEGAMMVPDYQLVNLIYNATSAGMLVNSQTSFALELTRENLRTVYNAVKRFDIKKKDKAVKARFNTKHVLVITPGLEETAWEILKQEQFVQGPDDTFVGRNNFWRDKFEIRVFDQLDNTTYHADAKERAWGLVPTADRVAPFAITYLNGQTTPTVETVDLPSDMLGFGVRGYWDVNLDYRPVSDNKLQSTAWSFPSNQG